MSVSTARVEPLEVRRMFSGTGRHGGGVHYFDKPIHINPAQHATAFVQGDFNGDGRPDLLAAADLDCTLLFTQPDGSLKPVRFKSPILVSAAVTGDFDGDGRLDFALNSSGLPNLVQVYLNRGRGRFRATQPFEAVGDGIRAADLDGDGKTDILGSAAFSGNEHVGAIYYGRGDGSFDPAITLDSVQDPGGLEVADVNADGKLDLVFHVNNMIGTFQYQVAVRLGLGNRAFAPLTAAGPFGEADPIAAADLNGDGKLDLLEGQYSVGGDVFANVFLGNGDGTFRAGQALVGTASSTRIAGDFNADGRLDLASAGLGEASLYLGRGNGTFYLAFTISLDLSDHLLLQDADLNADGTPDLQVYDGAFGDMKQLPSIRPAGSHAGPPKFQAASPAVPTTPAAARLLIGDFNNDRRPDCFTFNPAQSGGQLFLAKADGSFKDPIPMSVGIPRDAVAQDFNDDGLLDLATTDGQAIHLFLNDGRGRFHADASATVGASPQLLVAADLGIVTAGKVGLLAISATGDISLLVDLGNDTVFAPTVIGHVPGTPRFAALVDLDRDGMLDVVVLTRVSGHIRLAVLLGLETPVFSYGLAAPTFTDLPDAVTGLYLSYLDEDRYRDLLADGGGAGGKQILTYLNRRNGTFAPAIVAATLASAPTALALADLDEDARPDLIAVSGTQLQVLPAKGDGRFAAPRAITYPPLLTSSFLATEDLNRDDRPDLITLDATNHQLRALLLDNFN